VPSGFAHGFCVVSQFAEVEYKCTDFYDPADELRIIWDDASLGIKWPVAEPLLSEKDRGAQSLDQIMHLLPQFRQVA
jgi:dTDP-4-dehydrorhamnose 3,5-epimerase